MLPALLLVSAMSSAAQIRVLSGLSDDRTVSPDTFYTGHILVKNTTNEPQRVRIYQTDYLFFADGSNHFDPPGSHTRSNAPWIAFDPSFTTLAPGATSEVHYTVSVPDDAAIEGSYWSMLMVEHVGAETPASAQSSATFNVRYGIQIATHVQHNVQQRVDFADVELVRDEQGVPILRIRVANTGNAMINGSGRVELFDVQGRKVNALQGDSYRIYPGTSVLYQYNLGDLPAADYAAMILVDTGAEDIYGAQYTLEL